MVVEEEIKEHEVSIDVEDDFEEATVPIKREPKEIEGNALLSNESKLVVTTEQKAFLERVIPDTYLQLLFRASDHKWSAKEFHNRCNNKGPTVTIVKSSVGRLSGGFAKTSWQSKKEGYQDDPHAFLFSIDSELTFPCIV